MAQRLTQEEFIARAREVHGGKYDYSKAEYKNIDTKVCIICPIHGEFWQTPYCHINKKYGCPTCKVDKISKAKRWTQEEFIAKAREVHGDKYDYSQSVYSGINNKVGIICPQHGMFLQKPSVHLMGCGCQECGKTKDKEVNVLSLNEFVRRSSIIHNNKYDYSLVDYRGYYIPVKIICPLHGVFEQKPDKHLSGSGCKLCGIEARRRQRMLSTEEFIRRSKEIHGDKYDYSKSIYVAALEKVEIICPRHGSFFQDAAAHMSGKGCLKCSESYGEKKIAKILQKHNIEHERQKRIWTENKGVKRRSFFAVDFFLPNENLIIEFNGLQHYKMIPYFHKDEHRFMKQIQRDDDLRQWCKDNNIALLEIRYNQIDNIEELLIKYINSRKNENIVTKEN